MIVILGGGLAGCLLAYRLSQMKPRPRFLLIEAKDQLGGEHTWSFHEKDISSKSRSWLSPLIVHSWKQQQVKFLDYHRTLPYSYFSVTSSHLARIVQAEIQNELLLNAHVLQVSANRVHLNHREIEATVIFDARGITPEQTLECGFQKFVGMDLELDSPHGLRDPIIMDTRCDQKDGYRFFYLLPWSETSLLVEDTRYSCNPDLDLYDFKDKIRDFCKKSGWGIRTEGRVEVGSLPIPFFPFEFPKSTEVIPIGVRGGYFHWTTGYSFPYAVRVAELIAHELESNPRATQRSFEQCLGDLQNDLKSQSRYLSMLNRMLFLAAEPQQRWKIFQRFYTLNENLISRFYQGSLNFRDQARILVGRPPVSTFAALKAVLYKRGYTEDNERNSQSSRQVGSRPNPKTG